MTCCNSQPSRRTFLLAGGAATAAVTLAACSTEPDQEVFSGGEFTRAVHTDELPVGEAVQMTVGANHILLYRETEETVHAYSAVCTHEGCIVGVNEHDTAGPFVCPCHASNFDKISGAAVAGPAERPLTRHETTIEDHWILVNVVTA